MRSTTAPSRSRNTWDAAGVDRRPGQLIRRTITETAETTAERRTAMSRRPKPTHRWLPSPLIPVLALTAGLLAPAPQATGERPRIRKTGTIDLGMVETTPVAFRGRLHRFEY